MGLGLFGAWWLSNVAERADEARSMAHAAAWRARRAAQSSAERIDALEDELGRLHLVVRAMSEVLRSKGVLDEALCSEAMRRIDLEDGVSDGKVTPPEPIPQPPVPTPRPMRRRS